MSQSLSSLTQLVAHIGFAAALSGFAGCTAAGEPDEPDAPADFDDDEPAGNDGEEPGSPSLPLPLGTQGRFIVDGEGQRFKLASVNWYGAESATFVPDGLQFNDLNEIATLIRELGFNSVRLPWCNEMYESNPLVADDRVTANPDLVGLTVLEVLDAVIDAIAAQDLLVILDNHRSRGDWCCDTAHGDGLWYTEAYPEEQWLADWVGMAERYADQPAVVAADLRNELRGQLAPDVPDSCVDCDNPSTECVCEWASWGDTTGVNRDWTAAATLAGNAILEANANLLIVVEGPHWASWLGASYRPITLNVPDRVVYSTHAYQGMGGFTGDCDAYKTSLESAWGYVVTNGIAPLWLGEFGSNRSNLDNPWWACIREYMLEKDLDFGYWALNGTQGPGYSRTDGGEETFGILDLTWSSAAAPDHLAQIQELIPAAEQP